jgi:aminoglycoside 3-N-acetyltransferase
MNWINSDKMNRESVSQKQLIQQLLGLGVIPGGVLLVHCSFSLVKPVENGPLGLISALQAALGPEGTLVMPSMADDNDHPFDPMRTPCNGMGVVANTFWQLPNVRRSDSPHAFAARGPQADLITAPHPVDVPHGLDSPVGRVYELGGQLLLLGVGHDANTTIHLAESLAGVRYRRETHVFLLREGQYRRYDYLEIDHCCQNFHLVDGWLDAEKLQRHGKVGHAESRLMNAGDVVKVVTRQLEDNETIFLHPVGYDDECDEARESLQKLSRNRE